MPHGHCFSPDDDDKNIVGAIRRVPYASHSFDCLLKFHHSLSSSHVQIFPDRVFQQVSFVSSAPRTPSRSPVASHIFISPPAPNRNSCDSWNSSNYDFDDPNLDWKEDEVRLLGRTLDALPSHLITPFNGSIPPPNLLDKIARGITAAKGPNDWPHSVTATRAKLLDLARARAMEERRKSIIDEDVIFLSGNVHRPADMSKCAERNDTSPDVLQPTTNTPKRHPLYRQSSMDFMTDAKADHNESIARLSHRLQRHEHTFHHPYLRPAHLRRPMEHSFTPSTPSSSTLNASQSNIRKSTASSNSNSTFGTPISSSAPLRPSSLRRSSTLTLASSCDMRVDPEGDGENLFKTAEFRRSGGYPDAAIVGVKVKKVPTQPTSPRTPSTKNAKTSYSKTKPKVLALSVISPPKTPPSKPRVLPTTSIKAATPIKQPKFRKGHMPSLSISSDEEETARSQRAKKPRTSEPSWSLIASSDTHARQTLPVLAPTQITTTSSVHKDQAKKRESGRSAFSLPKASSSSSENDNEFSTASVETAATTVSLSTPALPVSMPKAKPKPKETVEPKATTKLKPIRRNLMRNPSMFGPELPCPQATPSPPSRIPLSSPIGSPVAVSRASPVTASPSTPSMSPRTPATPLLATQTRPRTLRRAARRISFGSLRAASPVLSGESGVVTLGSAFQLA
ncbi:uncharacterized protein EDB93DRAFT_888667 [Suillus bovinus]|uniref:uncharacterized protein n=1 Tax=Suillus bovinus TaxID=48563 RepID=UPI001B872780|nr:uncharacterized protein EDB93DRAFT_888667 [Suillus bovinus]KAG2133267.1 hypothetical protein EDB93DRAFT_888667 [Suillus bovinus]